MDITEPCMPPACEMLRLGRLLAIFGFFAYCTPGLSQPSCISQGKTCVQARALSDLSSVTLLQVSHVERLRRANPTRQLTNVQMINAAPTAAARLELLKPVTWLHIEKCGTTMGQVLGSFTKLWDGCSWAAQVAESGGAIIMHGGPDLGQIVADCPGTLNAVCLSSDCDKRCSGHVGIEMRYSIIQGHIVSMFRQPEQRLISGFFEGHSYPADLPAPTMLQYAHFVQGCQTKMLVRQSECNALPVCADGIPPTREETALALKRLDEGVAFVGITEQWDLSMCLFHAKFGGPCTAADFVNVNPGTNSTESAYDTSGLEGFVDEHDDLIFAEVTRIFHADLERFGVTVASCEATCWSQT